MMRNVIDAAELDKSLIGEYENGDYIAKVFDGCMQGDVEIDDYGGIGGPIALLYVDKKTNKVVDGCNVSGAIIYGGTDTMEWDKFLDSNIYLKNLAEKRDKKSLENVLSTIDKGLHIWDNYGKESIPHMTKGLIQVVSECPGLSDRVLGVIQTYSDTWGNGACLDERLLKTVEHIGNMGEADLAVRSVAMIKSFKYNNVTQNAAMFNEKGEVVEFDAKASINNVLSAYDDETKKFILNEASEKFNKEHDFVDPLAKKAELLAKIKQKDGVNSSKTGDSRTGKVSKEQKSAVKDRTKVAKQFMKEMRELNR